MTLSNFFVLAWIFSGVIILLSASASEKREGYKSLFDRLMELLFFPFLVAFGPLLYFIIKFSKNDK